MTTAELQALAREITLPVGTSMGQAIAQPCHYCGLPADTTDHVVPRSVLSQIDALGDPAVVAHIRERQRVLTVRACRECNGLAGAKYHDTLEERVAYVKDRIRRRYARILATPAWTEAELAGLRPRLRRWIAAALEEKALVLRRLAW